MSAGGPIVRRQPNEGTGHMIVIGADPHKQTHTAVAADCATGELRSSETVAARDEGHAALLDWARSLELRLLPDHREDLVGESTRIQNRLRWHLHDLDPALSPRSRALGAQRTLRSLQVRLARREQCMRTQIARELLRRLAELLRR